MMKRCDDCGCGVRDVDNSVVPVVECFSVDRCLLEEIDLSNEVIKTVARRKKY